MIDFRELAQAIDGELGESQGVRGAFATDASVYQVLPQAVVWPRHTGDVERIVAFCRERQVPLIGRGGGTSLSGQAIGQGLVVDFSRHMNRIISIDPTKGLAVVEPGVVLDELNAVLTPHGLHFAPDPATGNRATIGGMIGNNACGTRSIFYGRTNDSIESLRCLLPSGEWLTTRWMTADEWGGDSFENSTEERLRRSVRDLITQNQAAISARIPDLPRIAAGYNVLPFVNGRNKSWSDLLVGSEGTLAIATQATLRLNRLPAATMMVVSSFTTLDASLCALPEVIECGPSAVELLDDVLIQEAVRNASTRELSRDFLDPQTIPAGMLLAEFMGDSAEEAQAKAARYLSRLRQHPHSEHHLLESPLSQRKAWEVRRLGLGLISNLPGRAKGIALIEDACLPIDKLPEYNRFVYELGRKLDMGISTYAHASVGVLHYKVMLDLHDADERKKMRYIAEQCFEKCCELGGVFSGEHGDGIVRGEFLQRQFGDEVYSVFESIKRLFDPDNLFNPHRKIAAPPLDRHLRYGDSEADRLKYNQTTSEIKSRFRYGEQDNLVGAIEQCNGVGACRKNLRGAMCPSYRATRDERDSTRGRANLLRLAISGQLDPPGLANPELHDALELCLSCKACKSECPNAVDMARLKSEALQARYDQEGVPAVAKFIAATPQRLAWASRFSSLANWFTSQTLVKRFLERRYKMGSRREVPRLSRYSFDGWLRESGHRFQRPKSDERCVALFVDTWNRYLDADIGVAVVELLWSCGYFVEVVEPFDALRTRLSVGLLDEARKEGGKLFRQLKPYAERGIPILFIEPSEASAVVDDLPDLIDDQELGRLVAPHARLLDDWLAEQVTLGHVSLNKRDPTDHATLTIHPHCHQRAVFRAEATVSILQAAGYTTKLADWGCCGMAGAFGYSHVEVSQKIADLRFLPGIREALESGGRVVTTGRSCREQAEGLAGFKLEHWADLIVGRPSDEEK
ncbi:MAG: FAD-binding oxidoreductase [Pirellulaceae bacterium]|nr:FAD-binding oxidoreductase [Pirellulaceae bacterium]